MSPFGQVTRLPRYLREEQEKIERIASDIGLDFFPTVFEILSYDRLNEVASYGGFPTRYPHWRFGMEYERLSKSYEYGLSKIYEMVINNNPSIAYLLEGNSLTDQKLVMCHVYGHVDFFKNNFAFRATDLDSGGGVITDVSRSGPDYNPNRKWIDKMANHGSLVRRLMSRHGVEPVEELIDVCLSLENLIDPHAPFIVRRRRSEDDEVEGQSEVEVPRLRAKDYMENFINPADYIAAQRTKLEAARDSKKGKFPGERTQDVLAFLLEHAPLERWERSVLAVIRDEAYYFAPQMRTKIMNEGWASYMHSKMMTEHVCDWSEIVDYADNNAGVMATNGKQLNPYKLGVELYRHIEDRWNKGRFGREWDDCNDLDAKRNWDLRLGLGKHKIFEVRALYSDITFIDEFLTPEFAHEQGLFTFDWSARGERFEIQSREFAEVKKKLLAQLTNSGNPYIYVDDGNYKNRGELLLHHDHRGMDLRLDYAERVLEALNRLWKRPVTVASRSDGKPVLLSYDGENHERNEGEP